MIMCYQHPHYGLYGDAKVFQRLANCGTRNSGIEQYAMNPIARVITITAAPAAKAAKFQFHQ